MVFSQEQPSPIYIINSVDNLHTGKTKVKYAFRYNITPAVHTETHINPETGEEVITEINGFEYEEYIQEQEFDLFLKSSIINILKSHYQTILPTLESLTTYANIQLPKEINI